MTESHTVCDIYIDYRGGDAEGVVVSHLCLGLLQALSYAHPLGRGARRSGSAPPCTRTLSHAPWLIHTQTRPRAMGEGWWVITSQRLPLCNNQGWYHQRGPGRGTSAASLWRRLERWSQIPSSPSSFSVFGLQDPLVTEAEGRRTKGNLA